MRHIRPHLAFLIATWLCCQIAAVVAPVAAGTPPGITEGQHLCCNGGPEDMCPMHWHRTSGADCVMTSACGTDDAAMLSLSFGLGLVPAARALAGDAVSSHAPASQRASAVLRSDRPDPPPPRR